MLPRVTKCSCHVVPATLAMVHTDTLSWKVEIRL